MSLKPNNPDNVNARRRRRSADARLTVSDLSPRTPITRGRATSGASLETPIIISDDENSQKDDHRRQTTSHERPNVALRPSPSTPKQTRSASRADSIPGSSSTKSTREDNGRDTPIRTRQTYQSPCGKTYVYFRRLQSHESKCDTCKNLENTDRDPTEEAGDLEISDQSKAPSMQSPHQASEKISLIVTPDEHVENSDFEALDDKAGENTTSFVHAALINEIHKPLTKKEEEGHIYLIVDPTRKGLVKLGRSVDPPRRRKEHKRCGIPLNFIHISGKVRAMKRAENLMKIDLRHLRASWKCDRCGSQHGEWFKITEDRMKVVVQRWVDWINKYDPYDEYKNLEPIWEYLIGYGRVSTENIGIDEHEARWTRWDWILSEPLQDDIDRFKKHARRKSFGGAIRRVSGQRENILEATNLPYRQPTLRDDSRTDRHLHSTRQVTQLVGEVKSGGTVNVSIFMEAEHRGQRFIEGP